MRGPGGLASLCPGGPGLQETRKGLAEMLASELCVKDLPCVTFQVPRKMHGNVQTRQTAKKGVSSRVSAGRGRTACNEPGNKAGAPGSWPGALYLEHFKKCEGRKLLREKPEPLVPCVGSSTSTSALSLFPFPASCGFLQLRRPLLWAQQHPAPLRGSIHRH